MLLGHKGLVRAAWVHSAPHHGFSRGMKVGKEEAIAMLMAVEMWTTRDHQAEWNQWTAWLDHIARRVSAVQAVTTSVVQPVGLSNKTPSLKVMWDQKRLGISGDGVARMLLDGEPRIALFAARGDDPSQTGVSITPYMLAAGEEKVVADRLHAVLSNPSREKLEQTPAPPAADLTGQWDVHIVYAASTSTHTLYLRQRGHDLDGSHQGDFVTRTLTGTIDGDTVQMRSTFGEEHGDAISCTFSGKVTGETLSGVLDMGEYLAAEWTAARKKIATGPS
jgi:L-seryl-tRNA(Ser) seleniumtransferase